MPDKLKKNLLGREVYKSTTKSRNYTDKPNTDAGITKSKTRIVYDKSGNIIKTKNTRSTYAKSKDLSGKLTEYKKVKGSKETTKNAVKSNPDSTITKRTVRNSSGTTRSVETKKPGYTSTKTNMGPLSQSRIFRREIKKSK